jgi:hypothetical protein
MVLLVIQNAKTGSGFHLPPIQWVPGPNRHKLATGLSVVPSNSGGKPPVPYVFKAFMRTARNEMWQQGSLTV